MSQTQEGAEAIVLLARSAVAAAPLKEMERFRALLAARDGRRVALAFTEQGRPSLRETLGALAEAGVARALIIAMIVPFEQSLVTSLTRSLKRWALAGTRLPAVRLVPLLQADQAAAEAMGSALGDQPVALDPEGASGADRSVIPVQKRRVLVCMGGPCNAAGADTLWGHLRNEQERLKLRVHGDGMMSAKSSCLGPCNLAPVLQVWPEGTHYCGVDEAALDRIIAGHIMEGQPAVDLAYAPGGAKQALRPR